MKTFKRLQLFSLTDGRLSTGMDDVYEMLNYIHNTNFWTHQLPQGLTILRDKNPKWFKNEVGEIDRIKKQLNTNDFKILHKYIEENENIDIEVFQL